MMINKEDTLCDKVKEVEQAYTYLRDNHTGWDINQILTILNFGVSMWNTEHMNKDLSASFTMKEVEETKED